MAKCPPACPLIRVKCTTRKKKPKCTVRMGGQKWVRSPEKAAQVVLKLKAKLSKKGCRGDVQDTTSLKKVRGALRVMRKPMKASRRKASVADHYNMSISPRFVPRHEPAYPGYPGTEE